MSTRASAWFVVGLLWTSLSGCRSEGTLPQSALSLRELVALRACRTFDELFAEDRRIQLEGEADYPLSVRPLLKAVTEDEEFIVLDKLNVREIIEFDHSGQPIARSGSEGSDAGQFIYPHTVSYDEKGRRYFVYDGDLLRVTIYDSDRRFQRFFQLPLLLDQILPIPDKGLYCYDSSEPTAQGGGDLVYRIDHNGAFIDHFAPQSARFRPGLASEGGGLVHARGHFYVVNPYEYRIQVFDDNGRPSMVREFTSQHYVPPIPIPDLPDGPARFKALQAYHNSWSHIRQILLLDERLLCIVWYRHMQLREMRSSSWICSTWISTQQLATSNCPAF